MHTQRNGAFVHVYSGGSLYVATSYTTCIFTRTPQGDGILNATKYSVTTSRHQNKCRVALGNEIYVEVDDLDTGAEPSDLIKAAVRKLSNG